VIRTMEQLVEDARTDTKLRRAMLETKQAADPMDAFCKRATELGYPVSIGELFAEGEEFYSNLHKSCNGGATYPMDDWEDTYGMVMAELMMMG
jgi:hypothetical protein